MRTLRVHDVLKDRILVSRTSARRLEDALRTAMAGMTTHEDAASTTPVIVDFEGVEGVAPSFVLVLVLIVKFIISNTISLCSSFFVFGDLLLTRQK